MAKKYKPKFKLGGTNWNEVGNFAANTGLAIADTGLSALGATNAIGADQYKGKSGQDFAVGTEYSGQIAKSLLPAAVGVAAGAVGLPPQLGVTAAKGVQGVGGALNPDDPTGGNADVMRANQKAKTVGNATGQLANVGMMAMGANSGNPSMNNAASANMGFDMASQLGFDPSMMMQGMQMLPMRNGGIQYAGGGPVNAEVELQENAITPDGQFRQYDGPSHEQGGIDTHLPKGSIVFSDKLKMNGKTFADLNKPYNTKKEDKILENNKSNSKAKLTAQLMKAAKSQASQELFQKQEDLKQTKLSNYAKRIGIDPTKFAGGGITGEPNGKKTIDASQYQKEFNRLKLRGAGDNDVYGDQANPTGLKQLGFKQASDFTNKDVWISPEGQYVIQHPENLGYVGIGNDVNNFRYMGDPAKKGTPIIADNIKQQVNTGTRNVSITPQADPNRKPIIFGQSYKTDPNTGKVYGYDNKEITPIVEQYRMGGIQRFDDGGELKGPKYIDYNATVESGNKLMSGIDPNSNFKELGDNFESNQKQFNPMIGNMAKQIAMGVGQNIGNIYDLKRGSTADTQSYERVNPRLVDNSDTLRYINAQANAANKDIKNASAGNASTYLQNRASTMINADRQRALSNQDTANMNSQIWNQANQYNAQTQRIESDANAANQAQARNLKGSAYSNIGQNIMGQYGDYKKGQMDQEKLKMLGQYYNDPNFQKYLQDFQKNSKSIAG